MASFRIRVREHHSGPIYNGQAARAINDFQDEIEEDGAEYALRHIKGTFHASFKAPTGYYESHIRITNMGGDPVVNDGGTIAYGPWLEGVGSRNSTTRFKGYHAFRKATSALDRRFEEMGDHLLRRRYLRRIG